MSVIGTMTRGRWMGGHLLAFSGLDGATDFEAGLNARTSFDTPGIELRWPGFCRILFDTNTLELENTVTSDTVEVPSLGLRGALLDAHHFLIEGPCRLEKMHPSIASRQQAGRLLVGTAACFKPDLINADLGAALQSRRAWLDALALPPGLAGPPERTLAKALSILKGQVYTPEGEIRHRWTTPDRFPHRRMWLWDSAFHAIGWRHVDAALARDALSAVFDMQRSNGFIAHMMGPQSRSEFTQPPVLAAAVRYVQALTPDPEWLQAVYLKLCAYVGWDRANRDSDGAGLLEWAIEGDPLCRSGESGMDNSPRFDSATQLDAVDFNSFLAHECEILAEFAQTLKRPDEAAHWRSEHARLCGLINRRLWSEPASFYLDYDVRKGAPSPVLASSGFLPLLCGAPSREQARRLVWQLRDPSMFASLLPVPSIAVRDTAHYAKDMWRGPVWINMNWLIAEGLDRYGFQEDAQSLRARTMAEIEAQCERYGTLFEFYDDRGEVDPPRLLRKGECNPESPSHQVIHDYGWTASLYVDLAFRVKAP